MVLVFSTTTSLLAEEFVQSFQADKLAVALYKIAKETGVELDRVQDKKSFLIRGNWHNVIHAHTELVHCLTTDNGHTEFTDNNTFPNNIGTFTDGLNNCLISSKCPPRQRGRKPGTTVSEINHFAENNLPEPVVVHHHSFNSESPTSSLYLNLKVKRTPKPTQSESKKVVNACSPVSQTVVENICETVEDDKNTEREPVSVDNIGETNASIVTVKVEPTDGDDFGGETDIDENYQPESEDANDDSDYQIVKAKNKEPKVKKIKVKPEKAAKREKRKKNKRQKKYTNEETDEHNCDLCDYKGKKKSHLSEHIKRMHGKPLNCDVCKKDFGLRKDLARHKRQVHTDASYCCEICGNVYKYRRAYNDHMKIHTDNYIKPNFPCEICGKTFSTKYVLTGHVNSAHLGMRKSYECPTCGRSFTQKNSYLMHANVHAGIKPFVCDICGMYLSVCFFPQNIVGI